MLLRGLLSHREWRLHRQVVDGAWRHFDRAHSMSFPHMKRHTAISDIFSLMESNAPLGMDTLAHKWLKVLLYAFPLKTHRQAQGDSNRSGFWS